MKQDGPQRRRSEATKARLLNAALDAFAKNGFNGTTTRHIANAAGMAHAAVYQHHESKEDLLFQISKSGHALLLETLRVALSSAEQEPSSQIKAIVRAFVVHHAERCELARVVNFELAALTPEHLQDVTELRRATDEIFTSVVERGVSAGKFMTPNPRMAVVAIQSLGLDIPRWYRSNGWTPNELAEAYVQIALRILEAVEEPSSEAHGEINKLSSDTLARVDAPR